LIPGTAHAKLTAGTKGGEMRIFRVFIAAALVAGAATGASAAQAAGPPKFKKCADLQALYPHGVARSGAQDKVRGSTRPVTAFAVNPRVYQANRHLDRDRDGVACEKA
jgi:hypothetical protein